MEEPSPEHSVLEMTPAIEPSVAEKPVGKNSVPGRITLHEPRRNGVFRQTQ